jgi:hypothetical protein
MREDDRAGDGYRASTEPEERVSRQVLEVGILIVIDT